jgi:hypothetical protein
VLPAAAPRYAVTVWYFSERELSEAASRKQADGLALRLHRVPSAVDEAECTA